MSREIFERELQCLQDEVLVLGSMVEEAVIESVESLKRHDLEGSQQLIALDRRISEKRLAIEIDCLILLLTRQPGDGDLWTMTSILEIATELEHIWDCAKNIARSHFVIVEEPFLDLLSDIHRMAIKSRDMLHGALEAFRQRDSALAQAIPAEGDEVDTLYTQVYQELLPFMGGNPRTMAQARFLSRVARNLERAANRVNSICEWVAFTVTGTLAEMHPDHAQHSSRDEPFHQKSMTFLGD